MVLCPSAAHHKKLGLIPLLAGLLTAGSMIAGAQEPPAVMGLWRGEWINPDKANDYLRINPDLTAEVIGIGNDNFRVRFMSEPFKRAEVLFETMARLVDGAIRFDAGGWRGEITTDAFTGSALIRGNKPVAFNLSKSVHPSPTLGLAPPEGAVVLFDGSGLEAWTSENGSAPVWPIREDGSIEVLQRKPGEKGRSIRTRQNFGDVRLHIEFLVPYTPERNGQRRGNSGVFLQDTYEVQVLDSFGADGLWNECGALYKVSPPRVNASLPPGQWQTYDIEFRTARFDEDGRISSHPKITVLHNGIPIHTAFEMQERTAHTLDQRRLTPPATPGPILLQDHGNPVRFRNIWVQPLEPDSPE
jgi:hypothetical protein